MKKSRKKSRNRINVSQFIVLSVAVLFALFFFSYFLNLRWQAAPEIKQPSITMPAPPVPTLAPPQISNLNLGPDCALSMAGTVAPALAGPINAISWIMSVDLDTPLPDQALNFVKGVPIPGLPGIPFIGGISFSTIEALPKLLGINIVTQTIKKEIYNAGVKEIAKSASPELATAIDACTKIKDKLFAPNGTQAEKIRFNGTGNFTIEYNGVTQEEFDLSDKFNLEKGTIKVPKGCKIEPDKFNEGVTILTLGDNTEQGLVIGNKPFNNVKGTFRLAQDGNLYKADFSIDEKGGVYELPGLAPIDTKGVKIFYFNQEVSEMTSYQRIVDQKLVDDILTKKPMGKWPSATISGKGKSFNYRSNSINILDEEGVTINGEADFVGEQLGTSHINEYVQGKEFTINDIRCVKFKGNYCDIAITDKGYELLEGTVFENGVQIDVKQFNDKVLIANIDADVSGYAGNWIKTFEGNINAKSAKGSFIQLEAMKNSKAFGVTDEDVSVKIAHSDFFEANFGKLTRTAAGLHEQEGYTQIKTGELDLMLDNYGAYRVPHYKTGKTKSAQLDIEGISFIEDTFEKGGPVFIMENYDFIKTNGDNSYFFKRGDIKYYKETEEPLSQHESTLNELKSKDWYGKVTLADEPNYKTTIFKAYEPDGSREYDYFVKEDIPYKAYDNTREIMDVKLDLYDFYTKNAFKSAPAPPGWEELKQKLNNKIIASTFVYDINNPSIVRGRFKLESNIDVRTPGSENFYINLVDIFDETLRPAVAGDWYKPHSVFGDLYYNKIRYEDQKSGGISHSSTATATYNIYYELPSEISKQIYTVNKSREISYILNEFEKNKTGYISLIAKK